MAKYAKLEINNSVNSISWENIRVAGWSYDISYNVFEKNQYSILRTLFNEIQQ